MQVGELVGPGRGSRRLCAVLAGGPLGLLTEVCRPSGRGGPFGFGRLYIGPTPDGEAAVAPVGVDEVRIVHDLVAVVRGGLGTGGPAEPFERSALLAFNVGIVRVTGDGFGGAGLARTRALAGHPAVRSRLDGTASLAVVVSAGLYADLCDEGLDRRDWREIRAAGAWMKWGTG